MRRSLCNIGLALGSLVLAALIATSGMGPVRASPLSVFTPGDSAGSPDHARHAPGAAPFAGTLRKQLATPTALRAGPVTEAAHVVWMPLVIGLLTDCQAQTDLPQAECEALVALYWSAGGPDWHDHLHNGWNMTQSPCSWAGVTCSSGTPKHVIAIDRTMDNLVGVLPDLSPLTHLESLRLAYNQLSGSIPELAQLRNLRSLDLDSNQLSGSIPELSTLTRLERLALSRNRLTGHIPSLAAQTSLRELLLDENELSGVLPDLSSLVNLEGAGMSSNQLTGPIPDLSSLTNLQGLDLSDNQLDGPIPDLSSLAKLETLNLAHNRLAGSIPALGALGKLSELRLTSNRLSGAIPDALPANLAWLYLDLNQLGGLIPASVCGVAHDVRLSYNKLTGLAEPCPKLIGGAWEDTQTVAPDNVRSHALSSTSVQLLWDPIRYDEDSGHYEVRCAAQSGGPYTLRGTTATTGGKTAIGLPLTDVSVSAPLYCVARTFTPAHDDQQNDLTSPDGDEVVVMGALTGTDCRVQSEIPQAECEALVALFTFTVGVAWLDSPDNGWNVTQTPCSWTGVTCGSEGPVHVTGIHRAAVGLRGEIPDLSALTGLEGLELSGNHDLYGAVPDLAALVALRTLDLSNGRLAGGLPPGLPSSLRHLSLHHNDLTGAIPDLSGLTGLQDLKLNDNHLDGLIPDLSGLPSLNVAWLHDNRLSGSIPEAPASASLKELLLANNQLGGVVPAWVCQVPIVNVDHNMLIGAADPCMTTLHPEWTGTQTVPPTDVAADFSSYTSLQVSWQPIEYSAGSGYYEARCGVTPGGPYAIAGETWGKEDARLNLTGLPPNTPYYCVVRTVSSASGDQQNTLTSLDSAEVYAEPGAAATDCHTRNDLPQAECEALVALYDRTGGPDWSDSPENGWNLNQTPCSWTGVTCSNTRPAHVLRLERAAMGLRGEIPDLSSLTNLRELRLDDNHLSGGIVPSFLPLSLHDLSLGRNLLTGPIPDLSGITGLHDLDLGCNRLSGSIPDLSALVDLQTLGVHYNQLSGVVPDWVCDLPALTPSVHGNMLTSAPPCMQRRDPFWADTQTVPPTAVKARAISAHSIELTWTPILYTRDGGYYEARCGAQPGGPYASMGTTSAAGGKTASGLTLDGLISGTTYYCVVRTFTPAHYLQQSDLTSIDSAEVMVTTDQAPIGP